mmetsp:Transcript_9063/g.25543  ORF Transcript_9063/g.25543 Transcript_9063/m.25543 type:complete len:236 (+) Transcript_9063:812-1519(+)
MRLISTGRGVGSLRQRPVGVDEGKELGQVQKLQPRSGLEAALVVPFAKFIKVDPILLLALPLEFHHILSNHVSGIVNVAANLFGTEVEALLAARKHHDQERSKEQEELLAIKRLGWHRSFVLLPLTFLLRPGTGGIGTAIEQTECKGKLHALLAAAEENKPPHKLIGSHTIDLVHIEAEEEVLESILRRDTINRLGRLLDLVLPSRCLHYLIHRGNEGRLIDVQGLAGPTLVLTR